MADHAEALDRRPNQAGHPLPELSRVVITAPATTIEGDRVEAGTEGTIVGVWRDGEAYDVDFADAYGPATVLPGDLRPLPTR